MRYEVIGPKGVILASGLTKRQADTYCANCGGSVRAENPAPKVAAKKRKPAKEKTRTVYAIEYARSPKDIFFLWTTVMYEEMAKSIAERLHREHPGYAVRVVSKQEKV